MNPIRWMKAHAHGFEFLSQRDRSAIMHFALLWSLFEAKALDREGDIEKLEGLPARWTRRGRFRAADYAEPLQYFQTRYFNNGVPTAYFNGLNLNARGRTLVMRLGNINASDEERVVALLVILYRLRNNLFHGEKWTYNLGGQYDNFKFANRALMKALEAEGM